MITSDPGRLNNSNKATIARDELIATYREYLEIPDETVIDVCMSVALHSAIHDRGTPMWIMVIGPSGSGKTQIAWQSFQSWIGNIHNIDMITPRTFMSGLKGSADLLPRLQDKLVLMKDASSITEARPDSAKEIFSQLRHIYDGEMSANWGSGKAEASYKTKFNMIACLTDSGWDKARNFNAQLGERIVPFLMRLTSADKENINQRAAMNVGREAEINRAIEMATLQYMAIMMPEFNTGLTRIELSPAVSYGIAKMLELVNHIRPVMDYEYNGSVAKWASPDAGGRLANTLVSLAKMLAVLYGHSAIGSDELNVMRRICYDLIQKERISIIEMLYREQLSLSKIMELMHITKFVAEKLMGTMWSLNIVNKAVDTETADIKYSLTFKFRIDLDKSMLLSGGPVDKNATVASIPEIIQDK